jgi:hypothetical protein
MSVDISAIGNLNPVEPLDLDDSLYKDATEGRPLPPEGEYTVRAPESFPSAAFAPNKKGYFSAQIDPTIVGPTNEGYTLRFTKVSAKTFKRGNVNVSQLGDYLRATGRRNQVAGDPQAQADAVEQTANAIYRVATQWRAYCNVCGNQIEGMSKFPSDGNGGYSPFTTCPNCKDPEDLTFKEENREQRQRPIRANLSVNRYIPA